MRYPLGMKHCNGTPAPIGEFIIKTSICIHVWEFSTAILYIILLPETKHHKLNHLLRETIGTLKELCLGAARNPQLALTNLLKQNMFFSINVPCCSTRGVKKRKQILITQKKRPKKNI